MNDEVMQVFSTSEWNVNPHIISLELKGDRESWYFRKLHYKLLYNLSAICHLAYYFDVVVIFLLSFMTGSSLPPVLVDSNQRQSSGIILKFMQVWVQILTERKQEVIQI